MIQQSLLNLRRHATRLFAFLILTMLGIGQMWAEMSAPVSVAPSTISYPSEKVTFDQVGTVAVATNYWYNGVKYFVKSAQNSGTTNGYGTSTAVATPLYTTQSFKFGTPATSVSGLFVSPFALAIPVSEPCTVVVKLTDGLKNASSVANLTVAWDNTAYLTGYTTSNYGGKSGDALVLTDIMERAENTGCLTLTIPVTQADLDAHTVDVIKVFNTSSGSGENKIFCLESVEVVPGNADPVCPSGLTIASEGDKTAFVEGEKISLSASLGTGNGEISYQWYKGGAAISGATSKSYTIDECTLADAGSYTCKATKTDCEDAVSNALEISVAADTKCAFLPAITTAPADLESATASATGLRFTNAGSKAVEFGNAGLKLGGNNTRLKVTMTSGAIVAGTTIKIEYKNASTGSGLAMYNGDYAYKTMDVTGISSSAGEVSITFTAEQAANYSNEFILTRNETGASNFINSITISDCGVTYEYSFSSEKGTAPDAGNAAEVTLPEITGVEGFANIGWTANVDVKVGEETKTAGTTLAIGAVVTLLENTTFTAQWAGKPAAPTFDPASGAELVINTDRINISYVEGGTIYARIGGAYRTKDQLLADEGALNKSSVTSSATGTRYLSAVVVKDGIASDVATAEYNFVTPSYYIAGNGTNENNWCGGKSWDVSAGTGIKMEYQDNGTYTYTTTVLAGSYLFKVATAEWAASWGSDNLISTNGVGSDGSEDKNVQFTTYTETEVTVTFDPSKNNADDAWKTISVSTNKPLHAIPYVASSINGWSFALMDESDGTKWQKTFENVNLPVGDIAYKYTKADNWVEGFWWDNGSGGNATWLVEEAGVYDVTFEYTPFNPATNVVLTRKYQVTYAAGEGATGSVAPVYSAAGNLTLAAKGDLEKSGYKFTGWSDGVNTYAAGATYTISADVTLTAQWEVVPTISEPTVWDFSKLGIAEVKLTDSTTPAKDQLISYSDYNFENAEASFNLDALETRTEYMVRNSQFAQGPYMHFVTTVPGVVVVEFCNTGSSNGTRSLAVNGVTTEYGASNANFVTTGQIAVAAGDVELNGIQTVAGGSTAVGSEAYLRWKKISFFPTYSRSVDAGKFGTICLPYAVSANAVTASGFTFYNIESKTVVDGSLKSIALAEQASLEAGVPYLFEAPEGEGTTTLTLALSGDKVNTVDNKNGLVGTLTGGLAMPNVDANPNAYFVSTADNKLHRLTGTATATIGANKAYIDLSGVSEATPTAAPARVIYAADFVDQATGLDNLNATDMQKFMQDGKLYIRVADRIYDATGRLVK